MRADRRAGDGGTAACVGCVCAWLCDRRAFPKAQWIVQWFIYRMHDDHWNYFTEEMLELPDGQQVCDTNVCIALCVVDEGTPLKGVEGEATVPSRIAASVCRLRRD